MAMKVVASAETTLQLTEIFESVQGETTLVGIPATFVRLAACNLRCRWCDTSYSFSRGETRALAGVLEEVRGFGHHHVCITGGEPLLQGAVHTLMKSLCDDGYLVSLETGGSLSTEAVDPRVKVILDLKCPGSGMSQKNLWDNYETLRSHDEVKAVVADHNDYVYAKEVFSRYGLYDKVSAVLLSPVFDELAATELVSWILSDRLPVRLNLQMHKLIWPPETRGV